MSIFVWGFNRKGQLGLKDTNDRYVPEELKLGQGDRPSKIDTGSLFTAVVTQRGDLLLVGCGKYGRLGNGSEEDITTFTKVSVAKDAKIASISAGSWHTCAVTFLGRLYSWGYNSKHNVLGRDCETKYSLLPGIVPSFMKTSVKVVSCGHNFTLVITTDGQPYSWGCGKYGVLGHGDEECVTLPKPIAAFSGIPVKSVSAGYAHCGAVSEDGRLFMFGKGSDGALGLGNDLSNKTEPALIAISIDSVSCSQGEHRGHSLVLTTSCCVYAFGCNYKGKLGLGDMETRTTPVQIPPQFFNGQPVACVSAGGIHSGSVTKEGKVFTWGDGKDGRLGLKEEIRHSLIPREVQRLPKNKKAVKISCSQYHTVVLMELLPT